MLEETLSNVIQQIADFFGVAAEVVAENAPAFLHKYGLFLAFSRFSTSALIVMCVAYGVMSIIAFVNLGVDGRIGFPITKAFIWVFVFSIVFGVLMMLPAIIAPEMAAISSLFGL